MPYFITGQNGFANFFFFAKIFAKTYVGIVNDYEDTSMTTRTLFENFEGFSHILKEQSVKKRYFGDFTHPMAII